MCRTICRRSWRRNFSAAWKNSARRRRRSEREASFESMRHRRRESRRDEEINPVGVEEPEKRNQPQMNADQKGNWFLSASIRVYLRLILLSLSSLRQRQCGIGEPMILAAI